MSKNHIIASGGLPAQSSVNRVRARRSRYLTAAVLTVGILSLLFAALTHAEIVRLFAGGFGIMFVSIAVVRSELLRQLYRRCLSIRGNCILEERLHGKPPNQARESTRGDRGPFWFFKVAGRVWLSFNR